MRSIAIVLLALMTATCEAAQFRGITAHDIAASFPYQLSNPTVSVTTISGDGSTIGGSLTQTGVIFDCAAFDCATSAFVWSHMNASRQPLGELAIGPGTRAFPKTVSALSFDGSRALVTYEYRHYESGLHRSDAVTAFRDPVNIGEWLLASAMVPDASVVIGSLGEIPFRWSEATGFAGFSGIDPDSGYGPAAISNDGTTIILKDHIGALPVAVVHQRQNAIRWTAAQGVGELQPIDGFAYSSATAVSSDGSVIVGSSYSHNVLSTEPSRATLWIDSQPMPLAAISGYSAALDVSADGHSIVGTASYASPLTDAYFVPDAVLWKNGSAHVLANLLSTEYRLGDELEGWSLTSATAISDDGMVIAGQGFAPDGSPAAWVAILTVPEPGIGVLAAIATLAILSAPRVQLAEYLRAIGDPGGDK